MSGGDGAETDHDGDGMMVMGLVYLMSGAEAVMYANTRGKSKKLAHMRSYVVVEV